MIIPMERIRKLWLHPLYQNQITFLQKAEKDRIFCRHTLEHFLDVARLMYIYNLEENAGLGKELIYAAALLHDIGRCEQIIHDTPHHEAGVQAAGKILPECGFNPEEIQKIQHAISEHRLAGQTESDPLARYLYQADKQSRNCFCCPAAEDCNWPDSERNRSIQY